MMSILVLDAGNTRVTARRLTAAGQWPVAPGRRPGSVERLEDLGSHASTADEDLASWVAGLAATGPDRFVVVSVVPAVTELVRRTVARAEVADLRCDLPFATDVTDLAAVGPDRLCNMAAAWGAGLADALVVDAGTATTFDVLSSGVFRGGIIAPGLALAAQALSAGTARLPDVPLGEAPLAAATDTVTAMAAGTWHGGRGGVIAIVEGLRRRHGDLPLVVTGGLGDHLADLGWFDPDWTPRGAAWLVTRPDKPAD